MANAYTAAQTMLAALSATQKAAITIVPTYATPGDATTPVVSYTVTVKGNYADRWLQHATRVICSGPPSTSSTS